MKTKKKVNPLVERYLLLVMGEAAYKASLRWREQTK